MTEPLPPGAEAGLCAGDADAALSRALTKIVSLREGDQGVLDVVACGVRALPALRRLLFRRERSGLYQPRCRVAEAIAILGGDEILIEFLQRDHEAHDPVEAAGEEAVMNAAARGLRRTNDGQTVRLLLHLAEDLWLAGAMEVLGAWRHKEALPTLTAALADDLARPAAEEAIRHYGPRAAPALVRALTDITWAAGAEPESSRRKRRTAAGLLLDLDLSAHVPNDLRMRLVQDEDAGLSVLGCRLALAQGTNEERDLAARLLVMWLKRAPQFLRNEIQDALAARPEIARPIIDQAITEFPIPEDEFSREADTLRALRRIAERVKGTKGIIR